MMSTVRKQDVKVKIMESQGDLNSFRKEILSENEYFTPLFAKSIEHGTWPMSKLNKEVQTLVIKRQKYPFYAM